MKLFLISKNDFGFKEFSKIQGM